MQYKFETQKKTRDKLNSSPAINHEAPSALSILNDDLSLVQELPPLKKVLKSEIVNGVLITLNEEDIDENGLFESSSVVKIADHAFKNCNRLKAINLPEVKKVGWGAFLQCKNLKSVNMPKLMEIDDFAFDSCDALTDVDFPKVVKIGDSAFSRCFALTSVKLPEMEVMGGYAFEYCKNLKHVDFPNVKLVKYSTFSACKALTIVKLPKAEGIANLSFQRCSALRILIINPDVVAARFAFPPELKLRQLIIEEAPANSNIEQLRTCFPLRLRSRDVCIKTDLLEHLIFSRKAGNTHLGKDVTNTILTLVVALGFFNKKDKKNNEEARVTNSLNIR